MEALLLEGILSFPILIPILILPPIPLTTPTPMIIASRAFRAEMWAEMTVGPWQALTLSLRMGMVPPRSRV